MLNARHAGAHGPRAAVVLRASKRAAAITEKVPLVDRSRRREESEGERGGRLLEGVQQRSH